MTIDREKLKALAEAATPGRHYDRLESAGGGIKYECAGDDGSLVLKVDHKNNEFGFVGDRGEADEAFFLACSPAAVLALLAEIERLSPPAGQVSYQQQMEAWKSASSQDLRARGELMIQVDELKAENEALRKDAERYRWIRTADWWRSPVCAISNPKEQAKLGSDCPSGERLDAQIDAAMAKEASHG